MMMESTAAVPTTAHHSQALSPLQGLGLCTRQVLFHLLALASPSLAVLCCCVNPRFHQSPQAAAAMLQQWAVTCLAEGSWLGAWHHGLACLVISSEAKAIPAGTMEAPSCIDAELAAPMAPAGTFICI